jgi:hypothetical protein
MELCKPLPQWNVLFQLSSPNFYYSAADTTISKIKKTIAFEHSRYSFERLFLWKEREDMVSLE